MFSVQIVLKNIMFKYINLCVWFPDKADKKAQRERELKMEREQIEREEEIKELSLKMRRKYVHSIK